MNSKNYGKYLSLFGAIIVLCYAFFILKEKLLEVNIKKVNNISCVGELNTQDNSKQDLLRYLKEGVDMFPCSINIEGENFKVPYGRLLKYETLGIQKIEDYFLRELGPFEEMDLFNNLQLQVESQYLMVDLDYQFGFGGIQGCDLTSSGSGIGTCYAYFSGKNGVGKYKYDTFNEEFQAGGTVIECLLNRQVKNHTNETSEELLRDGVKECNVIYNESGGKYEVGYEFKTQKEKDETLNYITTKVNNEIEYIKNIKNYETIEGKIDGILVDEDGYGVSIDKISDGEMFKDYIITLKIDRGYYQFHIDGSYGEIKEGDDVTITYDDSGSMKVYSIVKQ